MALRCLIVDDSPAFVAAARALLEIEGVTVVGAASNTADALQKVGELSPDVTLVDIDLGNESGLDVVRRLQDVEPSVSSRVILISAHDPTDFADLIAESPVVGFLGKSELSGTAIRDLLDSGRDPE